MNDGRRNNRGTLGNAGGRKKWTPRRLMVDNRRQSEAEAWAGARALVRHLTAVGVPADVVGRFLSPHIKDEATLRKHFGPELENGRQQADLQIAGVAYRMAVSGQHELSTWRWLERRVPGFQPKDDANLSGPIQIELLPGDA